MTALKSLLFLGTVAVVTSQYYGGGSSHGYSKGGHNAGTSYVSVTQHVSHGGHASNSYGGSSYGGHSGYSSSSSSSGSYGGGSHQGGSSGGQSGYSSSSRSDGGYGGSQGGSSYGGQSGYSSSSKSGAGYGSSQGGHDAVSYQSQSNGKGESQRASLGKGYSLGGSGGGNGGSYKSEAHSYDSYGKEEVFDYYAKPKYEFEYKVEDPHTGDLKSQKETRDGDSVKGVYELKEPDGTILEVHYVADHKNGFNAEVVRKGKAQHPEQQHKKSYY